MATRRTLIGNIKGPKGDTGETGATGATGAAGQAATIQVGTVSTTAYGNTAQVINSGTAQDAVFDFVIPQGRPGEETTTMSALTLDTVTAQSSDFPVPATGESGSTVFGKIIKFFNDVKSNLLKKSDVVNNLTSTLTNVPLSAAQGRTLNESMIGCMGRKSYSYEYTVGANAEITITGAQMGTNDVTGKIPMAITAYNTGNVNVYPRSLAAHANAGGGVMRLKNTSSSSITATASITLLYIKTSMNENL